MSYYSWLDGGNYNHRKPYFRRTRRYCCCKYSHCCAAKCSIKPVNTSIIVPLPVPVFPPPIYVDQPVFSFPPYDHYLHTNYWSASNSRTSSNGSFQVPINLTCNVSQAASNSSTSSTTTNSFEIPINLSCNISQPTNSRTSSTGSFQVPINLSCNISQSPNSRTSSTDPYQIPINLSCNVSQPFPTTSPGAPRYAQIPINLTLQGVNPYYPQNEGISIVEENNPNTV